MTLLSKILALKLRAAQIIVIVVFLGLGLRLSATIPMAEGPDEVAHFELIRFVAQHSRLPIDLEEKDEAGYKSGWPPLFHLAVGLAGSSIDLHSPPFIKVAQNNPRLQLVVGNKRITAWRALTTEDPYRSEVLLWYLSRWLTLACGAVGIGATYWGLKTVVPSQVWVALSAAALLAFNPIYLSVSSVISYEPLLGVFLTFYFVLLFRLIQDPTRNWLYLDLGLLLGLACLTKYTPLLAIPILPLFIMWQAYRRQWSWRSTVWRLTLVGSGLMVTFGSWLLYVEIYFNQVAERGWINGLLRPLAIGADYTSQWFLDLITTGQWGGATPPAAAYRDFFRWIYSTFWVWGDGWVAWIFLGLWGLALAGLISQWRRGNQTTRLKIVLLSSHIGLFTVFPFVRFLADGVNTGMSQHFLFPAGAALMFLLVLGLQAWLTPARLTSLLLIGVGIYLGQDILLAARPASVFPIQTVPLMGGEEVLANFGEASLIGYKLVASEQDLDVTLNWRAEIEMGEDYRLELTLLDADNRPQARWLGQPLNGVYPTRSWMPGDRLRDLIQIPISGLSPGNYQVQLRWLGESGPRIPRQTQHQPTPTVEGDKVELGEVKLAPLPVAGVDTVLLDGQEIGYKLWKPNRMNLELVDYDERSTLMVLTRERLGEDTRVSLIDPVGQPYPPIDHTGYIYSFYIEPRFPSGQYHLRFEQVANAAIVASVETPSLLQLDTQLRQFSIGDIPHPVKANFAGQVVLLGYDLPQRRLKAGDKLPVTLYWQALKPTGDDLVMFNHLVNEQKEGWGTYDRQPHDVYSPILWAPGEIVIDSYEVPVAANAPDGIYYLLVGCYVPQKYKSVSLPLIQDGQPTETTNVNLGPIKIGRIPASLIRQTANPQTPLNQPFGDVPNLTLMGYDLTDPAGQPISTLSSSSSLLKLTLYWQSESPLPINYTTFVHLRNAAGETVAQKDQPPLNGAYPTSLWDPGEIIADSLALPLPAGLPAGAYQLVVGWYDLATGARLPVPGYPENSLPLGRVERTADGKVTFGP